jgi:hypothetical protein
MANWKTIPDRMAASIPWLIPSSTQFRLVTAVPTTFEFSTTSKSAITYLSFCSECSIHHMQYYVTWTSFMATYLFLYLQRLLLVQNCRNLVTTYMLLLLLLLRVCVCVCVWTRLSVPVFKRCPHQVTTASRLFGARTCKYTYLFFRCLSVYVVMQTCRRWVREWTGHWMKRPATIRMTSLLCKHIYLNIWSRWPLYTGNCPVGTHCRRIGNVIRL